jgi:subtilisin family serine protease
MTTVNQPRRSFLSPMIALVLLSGSPPAGAQGLASLTPRPAAPGRIIVKYRPSVSACAHCLLAHGVPFANVTGRDSLDRLNADLGVRRARALFLDQQHQGRAAAYAQQLSAARTRFPLRAARAAAGAALPDLSNVYLLDLPKGADVAAAAARYALDPDVEYAEPDYQMRATYVPNDPFFSSAGTWGQPYDDLWGLKVTNAAQAWNVATGNGIVVAVVDSGVKYTHPDLRDNVWTNPGEIPHNHIDDDGNGYVDDVYGWDFVTNRNRPRDRNGHGTHVAGIIGAVGDNGLGVVGMAWRSRIMAVRGINAKGFGWTSDLAKGIVYAAQNGADVLNNSWGGLGYGQTLADAVATATGLGAVVVFAAGNDGATGDIWLGPAAIPQAIAVGATEPADTHASFSNGGTSMSVSAPGVDILSLRAAARVGGRVVRGRYRRLSGTSMAAPHVAGLAATLLSAQPNLSPEEVRWHLELNADQPGFPGYEGQPWNPYFGWGRINAARVFDPPPVTTRIRTEPLVFHAFPDEVAPVSALMDFYFTTLSPVDWTLGGPSWLPPSSTAGTGPVSAPVTLDTTGLGIGTHTGALALSAPGAADGGGSVPATVEVHSDPRAGGDILVANDITPLNYPPVAASNGSDTLIIWLDWSQQRMMASRIDAAGNLSGPFTIFTNTCQQASCYLFDEHGYGVASDGTNFLVMFHHYIDVLNFQTNKRTRTEHVKAMRVTPDGQVLDPQPIVLDTMTQVSPGNYYNFWVRFANLQAAHDGTAYTVLWQKDDINSSPDTSTVFMQRILSDGTVRPGVQQIYPTPATATPQLVAPKIACLPGGGCLIAWVEGTSQKTPAGKWIRNAYGVRLAGDQILDRTPTILLDNVFYNADNSLELTTNGTEYFVATLRDSCPALSSSCGWNLIGGHVSGLGVPADTAGVQLNRSPAQGDAFCQTMGTSFDGTNYIAAFLDYSVPVPLLPATSTISTGFYIGFPIFAARLDANDTLVDNEPIGALVHAGQTTLSGRLVSTATSSVAVWMDTRHDAPEIWPRSLYAQRVFPH